jgi:hypothetical protein
MPLRPLILAGIQVSQGIGAPRPVRLELSPQAVPFWRSDHRRRRTSSPSGKWLRNLSTNVGRSNS